MAAISSWTKKNLTNILLQVYFFSLVAPSDCPILESGGISKGRLYREQKDKNVNQFPKPGLVLWQK